MIVRIERVYRKANVPGYFLAFAASLFMLGTACTEKKVASAFDPRRCMEEIPSRVEGLKILSGPRTEKSIIRDMTLPICNGQVLFRQMQANDKTLTSGHVVFRVLVEYTGEVNDVSVKETTIQSKEFLRRVSQFILSSDFMFWGEKDTDTVFLYPARFGE